MSYTPTNWSSGDIITATKLNKIEQGLSNTNIIANPTLAGTEADLTGLQVGDTKYKVGGSSGGGVLVVHATSTVVDNGVTTVLDKTWQEIYDAMLAGGAVISAESPTRAEPIVYASFNSMQNQYGVGTTEGFLSRYVYTSDAADGYPSVTLS